MCLQIGMRALPYKEVFISSFAEDSTIDTTSDLYIKNTLSDAFRFQTAVKVVCKQIIEFYKMHNMIVIQEQ